MNHQEIEISIYNLITKRGKRAITDKPKADLFKELIGTLDKEFNIQISTEWLIQLIEDNGFIPREKANKTICNFLKRNEISYKEEIKQVSHKLFKLNYYGCLNEIEEEDFNLESPANLISRSDGIKTFSFMSFN